VPDNAEEHQQRPLAADNPPSQSSSQNPLHDEFEVAEGQIEEKHPIRELIVAGMAFLVFLAVVTIAINAIGLEQIQTFIEEAGPLGPLAYIGLKAATYIFAPLTSGPIQVVAGAIFGNVWLGVLYTLIGEVLGGSVSFWLARRYGRPVVRRLVGAQGMRRVDEFYETRMGGWRSLAVARIVLFSFWDFLSYAAGLAPVRFVLFSFWDFLSYAAGLAPVRFISYVLVSAIMGFFPTFFFVALGNSVIVDGASLIVIYGLVAVLIALPLLFYRSIGRWLGGRRSP